MSALGTTWENGEAQFLATRGYAVVQVNYRGSGGRGRNFYDICGNRQMGTGMMQDMLDALKWAEDQGYVDKSRVCVYGASYGGYTAYFQPVYAPQGTFKCSVAIAGVSDIRVQANRSDTRRSKAGKNFLREAWGMGDPAYIAANSAIDHIDKFNVPVLIVHGEDDPRRCRSRTQRKCAMRCRRRASRSSTWPGQRKVTASSRNRTTSTATT